MNNSSTINNEWVDTLGDKSIMNEIWVGINNIFEVFIWADWLLVAVLLTYMIIGFKRGGAIIVINFIWLLVGFVLASYFYKYLTSFDLLSWLSDNQSTILLANFLLIFSVFLLLRLVIYKLLKIIASLHGPCPLNRFLAFFIGISISAGISWVLANNINDIDVIMRIITNDHVRLIAAFILIFSLIIIVSFVLIKILNVKIGIDRPCPLLLAIRPLDSILNARNVDSGLNNLFGIIMGFAFGFVVITLVFILFNHSESVYSTSTYINAENLFGYFKGTATNTQTVLADYLNFIDK